MMTIDQWAAEQCEIAVRGEFGHFFWKHGDDWIIWTIKDPRCREIVREHFNIQTMHYKNKWCCAWDDGTQETAYLRTIAEAEIACITAIYEASK